jgi:hypothetical protein
MAKDRLADLESAVDKFEVTLTKRWRQTLYDCFLAGADIPNTLHREKFSVYEDRTVVASPRDPEIRMHVRTHQLSGDQRVGSGYACAGLKWFEDGSKGDPRSVACKGRVKEMLIDTERGHGGTRSIDCPVGDMFALAADWAWQDRTHIYDALPRWDNQDVEVLRKAWKALVRMAGAFGASEDRGKSGDEFTTNKELSRKVGTFSGNEDSEFSWLADWAGLAAEEAERGFFQSTEPTLVNHQRVAAGLAELINRRAKIIDEYRKNDIKLVRAATRALGGKSETESNEGTWKTLQGIGMTFAIPPQTAPVGGAIGLVGWLGEQFLGESVKVSYPHGPGDAAISLYENIQTMWRSLEDAERNYGWKVKDLRRAVDAVPSTYLELYDFTENSPNGSH